MAEYIDKLNILDTGLCQGMDCDDCLFSNDTDNSCLLRTRVMAMETADVIERSKIDNAIKEIKEVSFKHHFEQGEYIGEITEQWEVVKLDHVLEILKRNIGE